MDLGTVIAWSLCGLCIESAGWRWSFYGNGFIGVIVALLWFHVVRDSPAGHPRIAAAELEHIRNSQKNVLRTSKRWPPIMQILRSWPIWLMLCSHYGHMWGWNFLVSSAPRFLYEVLGFDMAWTGALSSLTFLVRPIAGIAFASAVDVLIGSGSLPVGRVRKGFMFFCKCRVHPVDI